MNKNNRVHKWIDWFKSNRITAIMIFIGIFIGAIASFQENLLSIYKLVNPDKDKNVHVDYMRLFGALETPIIMQLITSKQDNKTLNNVGVIVPDFNDTSICSYCGSHIDEELINYWQNVRLFDNTIAYRSELWNKIISSDGFYGPDLYWNSCLLISKDKNDLLKNALYFARMISPWNNSIDTFITDNNLSPLGDRNISDKVGFLFLKLENTTDEDFLDFKILSKKLYQNESIFYEFPDSEMEAEHFINAIPTINHEDLANKIGEAESQVDKAHSQETNEAILPKLEPKQCLLVLIGYYLKDKNGYETNFLSDIEIPISVEYYLNGKLIKENIRNPYREKGIKIKLPNGWYSQ